MAKRIQKEVKASKVNVANKEDDTKLFAFLAVLLTIVGFVIALLVKKDNKYVMFYAKQGLILFFGFAIGGILMWIPFVGWMISAVTFVLWIIGLVYSLSGEEKDIIIVGDLAKKINF